MRKDECYQLGHIIKPHGLKGDLQILLDVDYPEDYLEMESVFINMDGHLIPFFVSNLTLKGNRAVVTLEGIDSVDQASDLRGKGLFLPTDFLPELEDDQFYFHEIVGFRITDKNLGELGEVKDVISQGIQDLIVMIYKSVEVLIPIQDEIIIEVDKKAGSITVELPNGLLDVYLP